MYEFYVQANIIILHVNYLFHNKLQRWVSADDPAN